MEEDDLANAIEDAFEIDELAEAIEDAFRSDSSESVSSTKSTEPSSSSSRKKKSVLSKKTSSSSNTKSGSKPKRKRAEETSHTPTISNQPVYPTLIEELRTRLRNDPSVPRGLLRELSGALSRGALSSLPVHELGPYLAPNEKFLLLWINEAQTWPAQEDYPVMNREFESWDPNSTVFYSTSANDIRRKQKRRNARTKAINEMASKEIERQWLKRHDSILESVLKMKMMPEFKGPSSKPISDREGSSPTEVEPSPQQRPSSLTESKTGLPEEPTIVNAEKASTETIQPRHTEETKEKMPAVSVAILHMFQKTSNPLFALLAQLYVLQSERVRVVTPFTFEELTRNSEHEEVILTENEKRFCRLVTAHEYLPQNQQYLEQFIHGHENVSNSISLHASVPSDFITLVFDRTTKHVSCRDLSHPKRRIVFAKLLQSGEEVKVGQTFQGLSVFPPDPIVATIMLKHTGKHVATFDQMKKNPFLNRFMRYYYKNTTYLLMHPDLRELIRILIALFALSVPGKMVSLDHIVLDLYMLSREVSDAKIRSFMTWMDSTKVLIDERFYPEREVASVQGVIQDSVRTTQTWKKQLEGFDFTSVVYFHYWSSPKGTDYRYKYMVLSARGREIGRVWSDEFSRNPGDHFYLFPGSENRYPYRERIVQTMSLK